MSKLFQALALMKELRNAKNGCAWTQEQTWESLMQHTQEEVYELIEAIEQHDVNGVRDELSDLLYHLMFYAEIAEENSWFSIEDIAQIIIDKHQQRMPSPAERANYSAKEIDAHWEQTKRVERSSKQQHGVLDGVSRALPALLVALKYQNRAARVGFDWPDVAGVLE